MHVTVMCDACRQNHIPKGELKERGWAKIGKIDICSDCVAEFEKWLTKKRAKKQKD